jgi:hypothetical protein
MPAASASERHRRWPGARVKASAIGMAARLDRREGLQSRLSCFGKPAGNKGIVIGLPGA